MSAAPQAFLPEREQAVHEDDAKYGVAQRVHPLPGLALLGEESQARGQLQGQREEVGKFPEQPVRQRRLRDFLDAVRAVLRVRTRLHTCPGIFTEFHAGSGRCLRATLRKHMGRSN